MNQVQSFGYLELLTSLVPDSSQNPRLLPSVIVNYALAPVILPNNTNDCLNNTFYQIESNFESNVHFGDSFTIGDQFAGQHPTGFGDNTSPR